ncbi:MAG: Tex-like N-terminal domain-containing protein, partial [Nakamurella sp.]
MTAERIFQQIATELSAELWQVRAAVDLLDGGATVPFVARYRKEATGSLDDAQLRLLAERLDYLRELEDRRAAILESVTAQGKLTDAVASQIRAAETKSRLEDVYLPFKPKRRTKAQIAREAGLEPLADQLLRDPNRDPAAVATGFVDPGRGVEDAAAALTGARAILTERFGEDADLVGELREMLWQRGRLASTARSFDQLDGKDAAKFADYFDFAQPLKSLPSHRILAMYRGETQGVLTVAVVPDANPAVPSDPSLGEYERRIAARFRIADRGRAADRWLLDTVRFAWRIKILLSLSVDVRTRLRQSAERDAAAVFAANLKDLLLAAPAGSRATLGLDPGFRTGVKVAVVDATGKVVAHDTIYPHQPVNKWEQSLTTLKRLVDAHSVELVAIGNGTASRETDRLATELTAR